MLILTSNGLTGEALTKAVRARISGKRAALVVTADPEYKERNYHVPRLTEELASLGLQADCFDFDVQPPEALMAYDVVELIGGNPYYLLHSIRQHSFADALSEFAERRCLIGCSAGALVLTPSLELIDRYSPEMNLVGLTDLTALNLTDVQILPHYSKFLRRFEAFEEKCADYERKHNCAVVRLSDGDGVILERGEANIFRG